VHINSSNAFDITTDRWLFASGFFIIIGFPQFSQEISKNGGVF
jgi:hypothetical protein